ncbi:hypothetical protein JDS87_29660 [Bacillus cereus]|uniref:hypothetical protein n=1 Tax=Bacillus cereus TaxID=1396 RepID=UPI0018F5BAD7|nr:hypothetical protein [Bacillus cereus]MBJ8055935.1 hypothetical protein [Bacillus cereus]
MYKEDDYCNCKESSGVYTEPGHWGHWDYCSDCNRKIDSTFEYYNEFEDEY